MRATTSRSQVQGFAPQRLAHSISVYALAAQRPPPSLPANSQFLRPTTTFLSARSLALLSMLRYPCSV